MKTILYQTINVLEDRMYIFLLTDVRNRIIVEKRYNYVGDYMELSYAVNKLKEFNL